MDPHHQLMEKLYFAHRQGGSSLALIQLMRVAFNEVLHLRGLGVRWEWIAARFARLCAFGVEEPMPTTETLTDREHKPIPVSSVRAAFSRVMREAGAGLAPEPSARDGPERSTPTTSIAKTRTPDVRYRSDVSDADPSESFFSKLEKLKSQSS